MPSKIKIKPWDRYWRVILTWKDEFRRGGKRNDTVRYVECICSCGNVFWAKLNSLRQWSTKSCWCLVKEKAAKTVVLHSKKHWDTWTRFYIIYKSIKSRCTSSKNKSYKDYWWRWIKCLWDTYEDFKKDMHNKYIRHCKKYWEENTTIERIDVDWDYSKENCRRATKLEQAANKRTNRYVSYRGKEYSLPILCNKFGVPVSRVRKRLSNGWELEEALFTPKISSWYTRDTFIK